MHHIARQVTGDEYHPTYQTTTVLDNDGHPHANQPSKENCHG